MTVAAGWRDCCYRPLTPILTGVAAMDTAAILMAVTDTVVVLMAVGMEGMVVGMVVGMEGTAVVLMAVAMVGMEGIMPSTNPWSLPSSRLTLSVPALRPPLW
jgi:hypothetical protein